jgi:hypothetical protein
MTEGKKTFPSEVVMIDDDEVDLFCVSLLAKLLPDDDGKERCRDDFTYSEEVCAELDLDFNEILESLDHRGRCDCGLVKDYV